MIKHYKVNDVVPRNGQYICLGCGTIRRFKKNETFQPCVECLAGTSQGPAGFLEEVEIWRFIAS